MLLTGIQEKHTYVNHPVYLTILVVFVTKKKVYLSALTIFKYA